MSGWSGLPVPIEDSIDYMPAPPSQLQFRKAGQWPQRSQWSQRCDEEKRASEIDAAWTQVRGTGRPAIYQGTMHEVQREEQYRQQQWWLEYGNPYSSNIQFTSQGLAEPAE